MKHIIILSILFASCSKSDCYECRENNSQDTYEVCPTDLRYTYISGSFLSIKNKLSDSMYLVNSSINQKKIRCYPL